jgi:exosortase
MPPTAGPVSAVSHAGSQGSQLASAAGAHESAWRDRFVLSLVLCALVLLYAPTVRWLFGRWTMSVWHNAHGLFIPPVVAYYAYQALRDVRHLPPSTTAWGFAVLIVALALHVLDMGMHTQLLSAFSIVIALPGLSLLFLGFERTKPILFPLSFLLFMLPIPLGLTEPVHLWLRQLATNAAVFLLPQFGVPAYAEETLLHLPNSALLVADACSGFSTLYAAVAIACLVAYTTFEWRRRLLVLGLAVPLALGANILRVALLGILVNWQGDDVLATSLHPASGMLTFVLVLPPLFWLGRTEPTEAR